MSTSPQADVWSLVPASLKSAVLVALTTIFLAGAMLYQENSGSGQRPGFAQGGPIAGNLANPAPDEIVVATPTPLERGETRSSATLTVPKRSFTKEEVNGPPFPALGRYVFAVEGTESASLFGSRAFQPEMTMTVHRREASETTDPGLERDELAFDLDFSPEHQERAIVAYRRDGIMFTFESQSLTFGPSTQSTAAIYDPPITQIPIPLVEGAEAEGTTTATSPEDGSEVRVEDWTVEVLRHEKIDIMGSGVDTLVVQVDRKSQPGAAYPLTRSRTYWLDPVRAIWVKWEERSSGRQEAGLGSVTYTSTYTATLDRIEPL
jgi:hypothetical protein